MQHFGNRECGREPVRVVLPFVMRNGIINAPDAGIEGCCSHKVFALGFDTLCYDAERRGIKTSARIKAGVFKKISV